MTRNFIIIFVSFVGLICSDVTKNAAESYNYCDPKLKLCNDADDHVMCKYPVSGLSHKCTPEVYEPLQTTDKQRILYLHNKFRGMIATNHESLPSASNMRQLYWDNELEMLAERWAQQCMSSTATKFHDECRNTKRFQVSQNVGTRRESEPTKDNPTPQIVVAWFKKNKDFPSKYVDEFPAVLEDNMVMKQFANMIYADSYAIGCARAIFQENLPSINNETAKSVKIERLICNYGPSDNFVGKPLYKRGAPCENCPRGSECSQINPGLCAIQVSGLLESAANAENQEEKEEETSENHSSNSKKAEGEDTPVFVTNRSNLIRVNEVQHNLRSSKGRYLIKKGVYLNGKCSLIRYSGSEGMNDASSDRISIDLDSPKANEQCSVIVVQKKKADDDGYSSAQKWTDSEEGKKTERDADPQLSPPNGQPCVCYILKKRKYSEQGAAPRIGVALFLFGAVIFLQLLLL